MERLGSQIGGYENSTTLVKGSPFARERIAVSLLFLMNGYIFGSWAPKIPEFAARLGLDSGAMGLMLLIFGLGSLSMMPFTGAFSARRGSGFVVRLCALATIPSLLIISLPDRFSNGWLFHRLSGFNRTCADCNGDGGRYDGHCLAMGQSG